MVGAVLALSLAVCLFTTMPACQRWMAAQTSELLSGQLQTTVNVDRIRPGLFNRIVLDDCVLLDQSGDSLFAAARLSAKIDVWELLRGRIRIDNVQLFGFGINLRRQNYQSPYNFQFIIDKFASEDSTESALDLAIASIIIRRGTLSHDIAEAPPAERFTVAHCRFEDLQLRASLDTLTKENIALQISKLSFRESRSGLTLKNLSGNLAVSNNEARLSALTVSLPQTEIAIDAWATSSKEWAQTATSDLQATLKVQGSLAPADFASLLPHTQLLRHPLDVASDVSLSSNRVEVHRLEIASDALRLSSTADGHLNLKDTTLAVPFDDVRLSVKSLDIAGDFAAPILDGLASPELNSVLSPQLTEVLKRLGDIHLAGSFTDNRAHGSTTAEAELQTDMGSVDVRGSLAEDSRFKLHAETTDIRLAALLSEEKDFPVDNVTLNADLEGSIDGRAVKGTLAAEGLQLKDEKLDHIDADIDVSPRSLRALLRLTDDHYSCQLSSELLCRKDFATDAATLDELQGYVALKDVRVRTEDKSINLNSLHLALTDDEHGHHFLAKGDFIDAHADGHFSFANIVPAVKDMLHGVVPSLVAASGAEPRPQTEQLTFSVNLWDARILKELTGIELELPQPGYVEGSVDDARHTLSLLADFPHVVYGSEDLRAASVVLHQRADSLTSFVTLQRMMESGAVDVWLNAVAASDRLRSDVNWDNHLQPAMRGGLSTTWRFTQGNSGKLGFDIGFNPTQVVVSDTVWNVHPSTISLRDGLLTVRDFKVSQLGRHLLVNGRVSPQTADTLYADLRGINLQYVFGLIDFHDVEFAGLATGKVKAHDLYKGIAVDADLRVDNFTMNDGLLGQLFVTGGFGRKDERAIDLDAFIHEPTHGDISHVTALIKPGHEEGRGMELNVNARRLNTYFLNSFTESIFTDLQGQTSGYAHLYGPFKRLDLEGDLVLDTLALTVDVLGSRYHLLGGDSVHLRPGGISFRGVTVYDRYHGTDNRAHRGTLNGELRYEHFKHLRFDFDITADDILGYDFHDFGDQSFYGTVYANGNVRLSGQPGQLSVDLHCRPTAGTVFTYNVSTPDATTENQFITFKRAAPSPLTQGATLTSPEIQAEMQDPAQEDLEEASDMRINFDLDITPEAQMRLLMDPRSEDYITLFGNGHIRANFYNKGRFQMYGTYHVDHGTYRLSLQDVIRKEFQFQPGSTITFGGNPMKGDLNLQAVYTVPSVSLNDLTVGSNFSASNVRVNCLMNIGGQAERPQVTFDFDIPNVNEDEKQMVRSLIATDEERNMQVIYLLGIGRFYTYGLSADQSQANAAMQSLLSSTLSGQLNNLLTNAIGNGNWNFGTNLATGNQGWNEVDVEGMLSGRLLNNRLLINGTFGYRDTPIANTNFIGDFDVQWLLTPSGNLSLKAYSETNDRYFTKTALTTQGIGLQVKKDFNNLRELFRRRRY